MKTPEQKAREVAEEVFTVCGMATSNPEFELEKEKNDG